jgi:hypothetical protein
VHPYRRVVAQDEIGTGAVEGGLPVQLSRRARQEQRGHRQDPARRQVLGQLVQVRPGGFGAAPQRLAQHHHVRRVGLGERPDHPHRPTGQVGAQLVGGSGRGYRGERVPRPQRGQGGGEYR